MGPWSVVNNRLSSHLQLTIDEMVAHYTAKKLGPVTSRYDDLLQLTLIG